MNKEAVIELLEALMKKYSRPNDAGYHNGVEDGIGHAWKILNGIQDDYLDGIDKDLIKMCFGEDKIIS